MVLSQFLMTANAHSNEKFTANECFEGVSRGIHKFNMGLDNALFKPIAKGYRSLPVPIRVGTSNAVENLRLLLTFSKIMQQLSHKGKV